MMLALLLPSRVLRWLVDVRGGRWAFLLVTAIYAFAMWAAWRLSQLWPRRRPRSRALGTSLGLSGDAPSRGPSRRGTP